ncbi:protein asteroid [Contarinia nasturtii]|uniref:protein asteroid n=1 Tax=Contarinia nasturtii TaxID=265458 RepID=UPI0012D38AD4|nr:protein asteroid [Contarinia nasturtii]XP_031623361.1 protein asteroid [Contarinia nasturtii]
MGVRGLTSYIAKNAEQYLDSHELHDCDVVVDGDSLACQLYKSINSAFGGNYDQFYRVVCNFFGMLKQCNVTAYVLLDGGYEPKKLSTVRQRLRSKIGAIKYLNPFEQSTPTFPIMMREVFIESLVHCNVKFMRCIFEADDEVAALARKLKCPVLSFDSDFYIHNVMYIPSAYLSLKVFRRNILPEDGRKVRQRKDLVSEIDSNGDYSNHKNTQKKDCYYYMQCCAYQIANLAREKGLSKEMLPLFAILLGNDYVHTSIFKKFYMNVSMKKTGKNNTKQGKRIVALLRWLQHETMSSAIEKIINHVEKDKKEWLRDQIRDGISGYVNEKSMAYEYFGLENTVRDSKVKFTTPTVCHKMAEIETEASVERAQNDDSESNGEQSDTDDDITDDDDDDEKEEEETPLDLEIQMKQQMSLSSSFKPPEWLLNKILSGKLPRYVVDLITLRLYINTPQVENFQLEDCNRISVPILQMIFTILHANYPYQKEFRYLTRVQRRTDIEYKRYNSLCLDLRFNASTSKNHEFFKLIFRDFDNSEQIFKMIDETIPSDIQLLFVAIIYWSRYSKHFNVVYVSSLLLCQIVLAVHDSIVEPIRDRIKFEKKFKPNEIKKLMKSHQMTKVESGSMSIEACKTAITRDEVILAQFNFLDLFTISDKLRTKHTEFSSDIIHGFAEFQSIVYQLNCLNALCGEPYPNINISTCINGCFLFHTYMTLKERPNIRYYVKNFLLSLSPNIFNLFELELNVLMPFIECLSQESISKRKKRRNINKRKSREQRQNKSNEDNQLLNDGETTEKRDDGDEESDYEDLNNKFSCLSTGKN